MVMKSEEEAVLWLVAFDEESATESLDGDNCTGGARVEVGTMLALFKEAQRESMSMVVPVVEASGFFSFSFSLKSLLVS